MKPQYLKNLWEYLKGLGQFPEYANYKEYRQIKFGIKKEKPITTENIPVEKLNEFAVSLEEKSHNEEFENWKNGMPPEEKEQFEEAFGK